MRLVTFNIASVDGRIAVSPSTPSWLDPRWKPLYRFETVDALSLHGTRVSLQGSNSFTARDAPEASFGDHAGARVPAGDFLPESLGAHPGRWFVVIDSRARVRWIASEMDGTRLAVLMSRTTPAAYRTFLREYDAVSRAGEDRVDLGRALHRLGEVFGVDCVVSDAGGVLNGVLLRLSGWSTRSASSSSSGRRRRRRRSRHIRGLRSGGLGSIRDLELISAQTRPDTSVFVRYAVR